MGKSPRDFWKWPMIAESVEKRKRPAKIQRGSVYWVYAGAGIGSEQCGKGPELTRPGLVLGRSGKDLAFIAYLSSQEKVGPEYYRVVLKGSLRTVLLNQLYTVDTKRLGDEIGHLTNRTMKEIYAQIMEKILKFLNKR